MLKKIFSVFLVLALGLSLCSCGKEKTSVKTYKLPERISATKTATLSEKGKYTLDWDLDKKCLIVKDGNKGAMASTPYSVYMNDDSSAYSALYSTVAISYIEPKLGSLMEANSKDDAENNGYIGAKKIEDGVRLTYYFDSLGISFPVDYTLTEKGLSASIIVSGIKESDNRLYSVSLLPYMVSTVNDDDSYIVVPSGSGALMYTDGDNRDARMYSEPVYGVDEANPAVFQNSVMNSVKMPVFGIKDSDRFTMGIIESGAESAYIEAIAGDTATGYSNVYAKFCVRGYAESFVKDVNGGNMSIKKYSDIINTKKLTVTYMSLDSDSTYIDMAEKYREYLFGENSTAQNQSPDLMLDFYGAAEISKSFLGIPYKSLEKITTFTDVKNILEDIKKKDPDINLVANLKGFGDSGLDYGKLAGGFKLNKLLGKKKEFKSLLDFSQSANYIMSVDFDTVYLNESSNGFSKKFDVAKNANSTSIVKYQYSIVTHAKETERKSAFLIGRENFEEISEKLKTTVKDNGLKAISLSTLSNVAYSDYSNAEFYNKSNMAKDVSKFIKSFKDTVIITKSANSYAAVLSNYIIDAPTQSSGYKCFDMDIPFYQIVFRGMVPYSSAAINLAFNPETEYLKAVTTGSSLYFTVANGFNEGFIRSVNDAIAASFYDGISETMFKYVGEYKAYLNKLGNSKITDYKKVGDLVYTAYDNGTVSCVNFGYNAVESQIGKVESRSFIYK